MQADDVTSVGVGETDIKLPNPTGMVEIPKNSPIAAALTAMIPAGSTCLKESIASGLLNEINKTTSNAAFLSFITSEDDLAGTTFTDTEFKQVVLKLEQQFPNGAIVKNSEAPDYAALKKKYDEVTKHFGLTVAPHDGASCLGVVLKDDQYVSFLNMNSSVIHNSTGDIKQHGFIIVTYLHVKQKLITVTTIRSNNSVDGTDMDILKNFTENYIRNILALNKTESP